MSKTAKPEPVACLWAKDGKAVNAFRRPPRLSPEHPFDQYWIQKGYSEEPLITTTQAEAYADARGRESLEQYAKLLEGAAAVLENATESMEDGGRDECGAHEARSMAQTIRLALIPSTPA